MHAVSHHEAHAASAFFVSPYERAAVLTLDGVGEDTTTAIWLGDGNTLTLGDRVTAAGHNVVADFVCPTAETRNAFGTAF